ncbi:MAG TPA: hypothetical protein VKS78_06600 [Roseiarcus sp.]|nr:hypothetical protein [Roseiarcus sp.]
MGVLNATLDLIESRVVQLLFANGRRVSAVLAAVLIAGVGQAVAEPRPLGINDLTESQQKILWQKVDRVAQYAVLLKACVEDIHFESRFVEAVRPCVESDTVRRVVAYYWGRAADQNKRIDPRICSDKNFVENKWTQKMKSTLDNLVELGHNLCVGYLATGLIRR